MVFSAALSEHHGWVKQAHLKLHAAPAIGPHLFEYVYSCPTDCMICPISIALLGGISWRDIAI